MLSKSAARSFFLVGTFVCSGAFVALTLDTFKRIPAQTNSDEITEAVARGKELWESNNCMGCHTIMGEGAYYAPELTKVYSRRGPVFIAAMLRDPEKMFPGERKMQNYHFEEHEIADLVSFLEWIDGVDLQGFPAKPVLAQGPAPGSAVASAERPEVFNQLCVACHTLGGQGGAVGPALDGVGSRRDAEFIKRWLTDPLAVKPDSKMPKLPLSDEQMNELVAFLSEQKGQVTP